MEIAGCMERESYEDVDPRLAANLTDFVNGWSLFWLGDLERAHRYLSACVQDWREEWDVTAGSAALGESYHLASIAYLGLTGLFWGDRNKVSNVLMTP